MSEWHGIRIEQSGVKKPDCRIRRTETRPHRRCFSKEGERKYIP